jgi:23S rRNA pseudouridine2605 synthase
MSTSHNDSESEKTFAGERIAKFLARAGVASRREAERMIAYGRVSVNGTVLLSPAHNVVPSDAITVDGKPLQGKDKTRMWLYHKPRGLMTTHYDPDGRPTVFEELPRSLGRVVSVGRLDLNSEGLLLLTNDGELAGKLGHPSLGWKRHYRARVHGIPRESDLDILREGAVIDRIHYAPAEVSIDNRGTSNCWLDVVVTEGKNREVRRMLEYIDCPVNRLLRVAFGPFQLSSLGVGEVKEIGQKMLAELLGDLLHSPKK